MKEQDYIFIGFMMDAAIRHLYCAGLEDFKKIFGEDGQYLWDKFTKRYGRNEGSFICYLDGDNKTKLAHAVCDANQAIVKTWKLTT